MLDRDNLEFFILSEEDESLLAKIILENDGWVDLEATSDELPKLQPWQEEILNKEIENG